jgi:serine/threonine protein kinase
MKQIDHPNIVKLHTIQEDEKYVYIIMELLHGGEVS